MLLLAASITPANSLFNQPIDVVLSNILISFGWIPVVIILIWGFIQMWQNFRQGKYVASLKNVILAIDVPPSTEQSPKALENLFSSLYGGYSSLTWKERWIIGKVQPVWSFEIASAEGYVQFYVRTQIRYRDQVEAGIYAQYPDAEITEVEDYAAWGPTHFPNEEWEVWGSELTTKKEFYFPIRTYVEFEDKMTQELKDPLGQVLEGMARMKPGEHYWYQILIQPQGNDWKKKGEQYINKVFGVEEKHKQGMISSGVSAALSIPSAIIQEATGASFGGGEHAGPPEDQWKAFKLTQLQREQVDAVLRKIGKVGFTAKIRMVYLAKKAVYDKNARTAFVKGFLAQYSHLNWNQIGLYSHSTPKDDYFWQRWEYTGKQAKLVRAYKMRSWGTGATPVWLNVEELASLWHFPTLASRAPMVRRTEARRAEPPVGLPVTFDDSLAAPIRKSNSPPPADHDDGHHGGGSHGGSHKAASHKAGGHGAAAHAPAHHAVEPVAPVLPEPLPPVMVPHGNTHAPSVVDSHAPIPSVEEYHEEHEEGLDATDVGPPADVQLPGPPPGWHDESSEETPVAKDQAPPNLPV